jgi:glycine/D-amino acid oxidase-like deaminating enzyme
MKTYDWLVIGAGLTGAALSYELSVAGFSVLLIEQDQDPQGSTRYSYGGIPYWSGTTELTTQLAQEGIERYQHLSEELGNDIELRNIDLLLTIAADTSDLATIRSKFNHFAIQPQLLDAKAAAELEPMLNPKAIAGAIHFNHAHVNPELLVKAYQSGLLRNGGEICIDQVIGFHPEGVNTRQSKYYGANIAVCAGGLGRSLLKNSGISIRLYFTHADVIETAPCELSLRSMVMPAITERFKLEIETSENDRLWDLSDRELLPISIDVGAIQFKNRQLRIGQLSQAHTNPNFCQDLSQTERSIREQVKHILPAIASVPGSCHHCLVAFTHDSLPLIGSVTDNIHIFSGFTSPFVFVPPLAKRFAQSATKSINTQTDLLIPQLSPHRFINLPSE